MNKKIVKRQSKYLGFYGFMGFLAFRYFYSHNISDLSYLMFFAYFSHFFLAKINNEINDEMYMQNYYKAQAFSGIITQFSLFAIIFANILLPQIPIRPMLIIAFLVSTFSYAVKFYILEKDNGN